jgi:hypothetical protein
MKTVTFKAIMLLILSFNVGLINLVQAQTLNLSSFSTNGQVNAMAEDDDNIYIGGSFSQAGYRGSGVAKIDENGQIHFDFPTMAADVNAIIPDGAGGWYIGGSFSIFRVKTTYCT